MSKIIVTGSSGFIGKHLVAALKESNNSIVEVDNTKGHDITRPDCLDFVSEFDYIIHLASRSFVPESFENPYIFYNDNYSMTLNVLEAARKENAKVIFFSSYLYGTPQYLPIDENHPLDPHNPYAQSKLICEKLCEGYNRDFGVDIVVFRPFNIYGMDQSASFLIPSILKQAESGTVKLKDPRPKRDFIHVFDVVSAVKKAIELQPTGYLVFNIGSGRSYAIDELTKLISKAANRDLIIKFTNEYRKGEVLDTVANINKAKSILFWEPKIELNMGLIQMIE